ncbi:MAG: hypothetical protein KDC56_05765 [Flavobacteriaceae bacterium]|nr:hypothetical protein [Flavobacteriaceae bacterium]
MTSRSTLFLSLCLLASTLHAQNPAVDSLFDLADAAQEDRLDQVVG